MSKQNPKVKKDTVTGRRGEFAFRLPARQGAYIVTAEAKGFESQQRTADVYEGTKTTVTFLLKPLGVSSVRRNRKSGETSCIPHTGLEEHAASPMKE